MTLQFIKNKPRKIFSTNMITKEDFKKNSKKRGRPAYKLEVTVNNETERFENVKEFAAFLEVGPRRAYQIAAQDPRIKKVK